MEFNFANFREKKTRNFLHTKVSKNKNIIFWNPSFFLVVLFLCSETTTIDILVEAYTAGFYDAHQYAFITIDLDLLVLEEKHLGQTEAEILNGIINIKARSPKDVPTTKYTSFLNQMNESFFDEFDTYNPYAEVNKLPCRIHIKLFISA